MRFSCTTPTRLFALTILLIASNAPSTRAQTPDANAFYRLTTEYRGGDQALDVFPSGAKANMTHLTQRQNVTGQKWRITPAGNGFFHLTTKFRGSDDCLDVHNGGQYDNQPYITSCSNTTGQLWQLVPEGGWVRLKTKFRGAGMCLDINPRDNQPYLKTCGNFSGQKWKLTKDSAAPREEVAGDFTFQNPRHDDAALDWCWSRGSSDCGKRVADWMCRKRFFSGVRDFQQAKAPNGTRFIGSKDSCSGSGCIGFASITCRDKLPQHTGRFANPIGDFAKKRRLDVCREFGKNCGAPVAAAYCKQKGFDTWVYWEANPSDSGTITIGSKQTCDKGCAAMDLITCK